MNDQDYDQTQNIDLNDPLGIGVDLNEVDTSRPVMVEGLVILRLASVEVKPNKKQTGRNLECVFETVNPQTSIKGRDQGKENDLNPGFKLFKYIPLQQSDNPKAPDFKEDIARLQDALMGTTKGNRPVFNPNECIGNLVLARVKITNSEEFGVGNEIGKMEFPPQD